MDLHRFARLVVRHGRETRRGTGYFLHGNRILTAWHVIRDADAVTV